MTRSNGRPGHNGKGGYMAGHYRRADYMPGHYRTRRAGYYGKSRYDRKAAAITRHFRKPAKIRYFYHYTSHENLQRIINDGFIYPSQDRIGNRYGEASYFTSLKPENHTKIQIARNNYNNGYLRRINDGKLDCFIEIDTQFIGNNLFKKCWAQGRDVYTVRGMVHLRNFQWRCGVTDEVYYKKGTEFGDGDGSSYSESDSGNGSSFSDFNSSDYSLSYDEQYDGQLGGYPFQTPEKLAGYRPTQRQLTGYSPTQRQLADSPPTTGQLSGYPPQPTGQLAGYLPQTTGQLAGYPQSPGQLEGYLPQTTGQLAGYPQTPGQLAGYLHHIPWQLVGYPPKTPWQLAGYLPQTPGQLTCYPSQTSVQQADYPQSMGQLAGYSPQTLSQQADYPQSMGQLAGYSPQTMW